jgi:hypothetical protein
MKRIKITIKCEGLKVRTNDLEMGKGILDQIDSRGIMNYIFMPNSLLRKTIETIKMAGSKIEELREKQSAKKESKFYIFPNDQEEKIKEPVDETKKESNDRTIHSKEKKRTVYTWTDEEKSILKNNIDLSDKELAKLLPGRSINGIIYKKRNMLGLNNRYRKTKNRRKSWTKRELEVLRNNLHLTPKQLLGFPELKGRSKGTISWKKIQLKRKLNEK